VQVTGATPRERDYIAALATRYAGRTTVAQPAGR